MIHASTDLADVGKVDSFVCAQEITQDDSVKPKNGLALAHVKGAEVSFF